MVSVVIPVYNSGKTALIALKSVLIQTYIHWEIILVDDGSKDNSFFFIKSYLEKLPPEQYDKIRLFRQVNKGPSSARNLGIEKAKGEYIAFLDSDDEWDKDKLQIQIEYFNNDNLLCFCGAAFGKRRFPSHLKSQVISFKKALFKNYFSTPTVVVKSQILKNIRFDVNQKYSEDYKLWLQIAYQYKCIYINSVLAKNQSGKSDYGDSGLSANLWQMEKGEISNYIYLYNSNSIGMHILIICIINSILKFFIRFFKSNISFKSFLIKL